VAHPDIDFLWPSSSAALRSTAHMYVMHVHAILSAAGAEVSQQCLPVMGAFQSA
jgi:hypothetical protein